MKERKILKERNEIMKERKGGNVERKEKKQ